MLLQICATFVIGGKIWEYSIPSAGMGVNLQIGFSLVNLQIFIYSCIKLSYSFCNTPVWLYK